jgi:MoaA/NifB/PqqE/SkfB family radical SAM enzyme
MFYNKSLDQVIGLNDIDYFYSVALKITTKCDFLCDFCCENNYSKDRKANLFDWSDIITRLIEHGTKRFCITGGEPLLCENFSEIIKTIKNYGGYVSLCTASGNYFIKNINEISESVDFVRFSIHGNEKYHDNITKKSGSYKELLKAIALTHERNIPFSISTVVTNGLLHEILPFVENAVLLNVKKIDFFPILKSGNGLAYLKSHSCDFKYAKEKILELQAEFKQKILINYYDYEYPECVLIYLNGDVVVDPYPHNIENQLTIGNIFQNSIIEVWNAFWKLSAVNTYLEHLKK